MTPIKAFWHLLRYQPAHNILLIFVTQFNMVVVPLLLGLIMRTVFNSLTGNAPVGIGLWELAALLVATESAGIVMSTAGVYLNCTLFYTQAAVLRSNLFEAILGRPAARALPDSPGEAISRLRDDVIELPVTTC